MHELNICHNLLRIIDKQITEHQIKDPNFKYIKTIWLEIGALAGIEIDAIRFSFPIAAAHSAAKNAKLEIIVIPGQARCHNCQDSVTIKTYFDSCPCCGSYDYQIIKGKELRLLKMELA